LGCLIRPHSHFSWRKGWFTSNLKFVCRRTSPWWWLRMTPAVPFAATWAPPKAHILSCSPFNSALLVDGQGIIYYNILPFNILRRPWGWSYYPIVGNLRGVFTWLPSLGHRCAFWHDLRGGQEVRSVAWQCRIHEEVIFESGLVQLPGLITSTT
jgi:hypothetical protein